MIFIVIIWIVCGIITANIAASRGHAGCLWFAIGFLLGPIGVLLALASGQRFRCPYCKEGVQEHATICPHCRSKLGVSDKPPKW